jgi:hypothetical protein
VTDGNVKSVGVEPQSGEGILGEENPKEPGAITEAAPADSPSTASVAQKGGRVIVPERVEQPADAHFFDAAAVLATVTEPLGLCAVPWQASTQVLVARL